MITHSRDYIEFTTFLTNLNTHFGPQHPVMLLTYACQLHTTRLNRIQTYRGDLHTRFLFNRYRRRAIKLAYRIWRRRNRPQLSEDPTKIATAQAALVINETLYMPPAIRKALYIQTRHLRNKPLPLP